MTGGRLGGEPKLRHTTLGQLFPDDVPAPTRWVAFSDLHLTRATLGTCLEVLARVHAVAVERDAGILFLGDFWTLRSLLPVTPLNEVLAVLSGWTQPAIFIPGNHDQVALGGEDNSMTPLGKANRRIAVLDAPTVVVDLGALFLPYRKDHTLLVDQIAAAHDAGVSTVFAHVETVGAAANSTSQLLQHRRAAPRQQQQRSRPQAAATSMRASDLPPGVTMYSGHYHKPQTIPSGGNTGSKIVYIGSPYEVSLAEKGEQKRLLYFPDSASFLAYEELPISLGTKHFVVEPPNSDTDVVHPKQLEAVAAKVGPGDRLVLKCNALAEGCQPIREQLEELGVKIETWSIAPPEHRQSSLLEFDRLDPADRSRPVDLWRLYCESKALSDPVVNAGVDLLIEAAGQDSEDVRGRASAESGVKHVHFDAVELQNYGPFAGRLRYPLASRGCVLVRGQNVTDPGAASNGSGKSSLLFATLFGLTGRESWDDGRSFGSSSDKSGLGRFVHDGARVAEVRVLGMVDGKPFVVVRRVLRKGDRAAKFKHELTFEYDGADLTTLEIRKTQQQIDRVLGDTEVLARAVFQGQHASSILLGTTDTAVKEELQRVLRMHRWLGAKALATERAKAAKAELDTLQTNVLATQRVISEYSTQHDRVSSARADWEATRRLRELEMRQNLGGDEMIDSIDVISNLLVVNTEERAKLTLTSNALQDRASAEARHQEQLNLLAADQVAMADSHAARLEQLHGGVVEFIEDNYKGRLLCEGADFQALAERALRDATASRGRAAEQISRDLRRVQIRFGQAAALAVHARGVHRRQQESIDGQIPLREVLGDPDERDAAQKVAADADVRLVKVKRRFRELHRRSRTDSEALEAALCTAGRLSDLAAEHARERDGPVVPSSTIDLHLFGGGQLEVGGDADAVAAGVQRILGALSRSKDRESGIVAEVRACQTLLEDLCQEHWRLQAQFKAATARRELGQDNPHDIQLVEFARMLASAKTGLASDLTDLVALQTAFGVCKVVEQAFGVNGIQLHLFEQALHHIEQRAATHLAALSGGTLGIELRLATEGRERLRQTVKVRGADGEFVVRDLRSLSGGQYRRQSLAMILAFAEFIGDRACRSNMLVLDEVLNGLDSEGRRRVAALLTGLGYESVFVVSHDDDVGGDFSTIDMVEKNGASSHVIIEAGG